MENLGPVCVKLLRADSVHVAEGFERLRVDRGDFREAHISHDAIGRNPLCLRGFTAPGAERVRKRPIILPDLDRLSDAPLLQIRARAH